MIEILYERLNEFPSENRITNWEYLNTPLLPFADGPLPQKEEFQPDKGTTNTMSQYEPRVHRSSPLFFEIMK